MGLTLSTPSLVITFFSFSYFKVGFFLILLGTLVSCGNDGSYTHDNSGDTALPYKHDTAGDKALPYKHDASGDKGLPYKHDTSGQKGTFLKNMKLLPLGKN